MYIFLLEKKMKCFSLVNIYRMTKKKVCHAHSNAHKSQTL